MTHFVATRVEIAEEEQMTAIKKRDKARNEMIAKFEAENAPLSDYDK